MMKRITAAWKVLRGEWTAHAPDAPVLYTPVLYTTSSAANTTVKWDWTGR
jgi:hypothetical protein